MNVHVEIGIIRKNKAVLNAEICPWSKVDGLVELATSAGLPHPEIEDAGGAVKVCFRDGRYVPSRRDVSDLTAQQQAIIELLEQSDRALALREIHSQLGPQTNERRLREDLATLKVRGLAKSTGRGRGARWKPL